VEEDGMHLTKDNGSVRREYYAEVRRRSD
jgi:hypothetical protein